MALSEQYRKVGVKRTKQQPYREHFGEGDQRDHVFCNPDGSPPKPDTVSASVSLLFRHLKHPKGASLHALRNAHGSHLFAAGVPPGRGQQAPWAHNPHVTVTVYAMRCQAGAI